MKAQTTEAFIIYSKLLSFCGVKFTDKMAKINLITDITKNVDRKQ